MIRRGWIVAGALALAALPVVPAGASGGSGVPGSSEVRLRVDRTGMDRVGMAPVRPGDGLVFRIRLAGMGREAELAVAAAPAGALVAVSCSAGGPRSAGEGMGAFDRADIAGGGSAGARMCELGDVSGQRAVDVLLSVPRGAERVVLAAVARMRDVTGDRFVTATRTVATPVTGSGRSGVRGARPPRGEAARAGAVQGSGSERAGRAGLRSVKVRRWASPLGEARAAARRAADQAARPGVEAGRTPSADPADTAPAYLPPATASVPPPEVRLPEAVPPANPLVAGAPGASYPSGDGGALGLRSPGTSGMPGTGGALGTGGSPGYGAGSGPRLGGGGNPGLGVGADPGFGVGGGASPGAVPGTGGGAGLGAAGAGAIQGGAVSGTAVPGGVTGPGAPLPWVVVKAEAPLRGDEPGGLVRGVAGFSIVTCGIGVLMGGLWLVSRAHRLRRPRKVF